MRDIKTRAPPECDIVLCGNKCDLDNDRVVQYDEGKQLADEYGVQFFETSALTGHHVEPMFTALATTIKRKRIDEFEQKHGSSSSSTNNNNNSTMANGGTGTATDARGRSTDGSSGGGTVNLAAGMSSDPSSNGTKSSKSNMCCQ
jgi:GTPase SAR1 family protein